MNSRQIKQGCRNVIVAFAAAFTMHEMCISQWGDAAIDILRK